MIDIFPDENDDAEFIRIVEKILNGFVKTVSPEKIRVIKIDNWFDHKWREFAGKAVGAVGIWSREKVRVPPFIPDRVLEETLFEKSGDAYQKQKNAGYIHYYQSSSENLTEKRKLVAFGEPKLYFWFSGNTDKSLRGSVMLYQIEETGSSTLYVSFLKKEDWQIYKTDGISRQEVLSFI